MASIRSGIGENMEDRYLFKAKRIDNGEWVEGYLIYSKKDCYICEKPYECMDEYSSLNGQSYGFGGFKLVDPSTICQCTGLKDKNGNLIWENDIMVAHLDDAYPEDETYIRILWYKSGFCSKEKGSEDISPIDKFGQEHFEVCGNIFDNPELLESEE